MTINYRKTLFFLAFSVSIYIVKEANFLFYNSTDGPDFDTYSVYLEYLFNNLSSTGREQGLFYYYIQSWYFYLNYSSFDSLSFYTLLHKSILELNFILFLIGLLGLYKLLRFFKFDYYTAILTLIFINFVPLSIAQRIVFKPEILTFAFLPWIILCMEKFKNEKNLRYLFLAIPFLIISTTSKGSLLVMVVLFLIIFYLKDLFNLNLKSILYLALVFFISFSLVISEDTVSNGKNLSELESGARSDLNYNYKAPVSIIYNIDIYELVSSPIKNNHADSFIAITLLDTFGDYYDIYWDNDASLFFKNRREVLQFKESKEIKAPVYDSSSKSFVIYLQNLTDTYYRKFIGMILSLFFYFLLYKEIRDSNKLKKFLLAPLIGMSVLLIHVISGFPANNFNPDSGDTLKPLYYAPLFLLGAAFLAAKLFKKNIKNKLLILPFIFIALLITGFPKNLDSEMQRDISQINSYSSTCSINNTFLSTLGYIESKDCNKGVVTRQLEYEFMNYENYDEKPRFKVINTIIGLTSLLSLLVLIFNIKNLNIFRFSKIK